MKTRYDNSPWRPLFWEPVEGTGERLMVGIIYRYNGIWNAKRIMRDDVLDDLYGKTSGEAIKLIDFSLKTFREIAKITGNINDLDSPILGIHAGEYRETTAESESALLRIAALMYSSLANIDALDDEEENSSLHQVDVDRRFTTTIRELVRQRKPQLVHCFNQELPLGKSGNNARFGFHYNSRLVHFSLLRPQSISNDIRTTRAKLWELSMALSDSNIVKQASLITAVPPNNDPLTSDNKLKKIADLKHGVMEEAGTNNIRFQTVHSAEEASDFVLELAM